MDIDYFEKILRPSIDKIGQQQAIEVVKIGDGTYRIIDGMHRLYAAASLGHQAIICRWCRGAITEET